MLYRNAMLPSPPCEHLLGGNHDEIYAPMEVTKNGIFMIIDRDFAIE